VGILHGLNVNLERFNFAAECKWRRRKTDGISQ